jgi:hypothetical protein
MSPANEIILGGIYQHYKGSKVKVISEAMDSETLEELVVYIHLEDGVVWVRPKKMFLENIEKKGKMIPRFTFIGKPPIPS